MMSNEPVPREFIVVEGKADTQRLQQVFGTNIKTIETNGSAVDARLRPLLSRALEMSGLIVLTDPDYQGERIRTIIRQWYPEAKHAYITREEGRSARLGDSLGIEHASDLAIRRSLQQVLTPVEGTSVDPIQISDLVRWKLTGHPQAAWRREQLSAYFHIGPVNAKQLIKRLNEFQITKEQIQHFIEGLEGSVPR